MTSSAMEHPGGTRYQALRRLKVDDEFEFGRLQHRQIGRLRALRILPV
jgi:hypothetical protein